MQFAISAIETSSDTKMLLVASFCLFVLHFLKMKCLCLQELCELKKTTSSPSRSFTVDTHDAYEHVKIIFAHKQ